MRSDKIEGFGSIYGGEYDVIKVEGMGKLKGDTNANMVRIEGMFKAKSKLTANEVNIEGIARIHRNMKAKKLIIDGILKMRHANLIGDFITCQGILSSNREVSADEINIEGICSVAKMHGDNIIIKKNVSYVQHKNGAHLTSALMLVGRGYFGRPISMKHNLIDEVECTNLTASGLKSKIVRASSVTLEDHCIIERLYCDGNISITPDCKISKIISKNKATTYQRGEKVMDNSSIKKILNLYKDGTINVNEAEQMLQSTINSSAKVNQNAPDLPWRDDGALRIVAFIGTKLLKKGDARANTIEVKYDGPAMNVESYGTLFCGEVMGDAHAGGSIHCGNISGNVSCGGSLTGGNITGNCSCGGSIKCSEISGGISSGGGIHFVNSKKK